MAQMVKNLPAMQETWVRSLGQEAPLEEGMATHSSILAWRIPWTEEPHALPQPMGVWRVGHDWGTNTFILFHKQLKNNDVIVSGERWRDSLRIYIYSSSPIYFFFLNLHPHSEGLCSKTALPKPVIFKMCTVWDSPQKEVFLSQISVVNAANNSTQLELGHHRDVEGSLRAKNLKKNRYMWMYNWINLL